MQLGNLADEGQAKSRARRLGILHARNPVELFEDAGQVAFRNSVALVCYFDDDGIVVGAGGDNYLCAGGTVLDRVRDQVLERSREQVRIGEERGKIGRKS